MLVKRRLIIPQFLKDEQTWNLMLQVLNAAVANPAKPQSTPLDWVIVNPIASTPYEFPRIVSHMHSV